MYAFKNDFFTSGSNIEFVLCIRFHLNSVVVCCKLSQYLNSKMKKTDTIVIQKLYPL